MPNPLETTYADVQQSAMILDRLASTFPAPDEDKTLTVQTVHYLGTSLYLESAYKAARPSESACRGHEATAFGTGCAR